MNEKCRGGKVRACRLRGSIAGRKWLLIAAPLFGCMLLVMDAAIVLFVGKTASTPALLYESVLTLLMLLMLMVRPVLRWHGWLGLFLVFAGSGVLCAVSITQDGWTVVTLGFILQCGVIGACIVLAWLTWPMVLPRRRRQGTEQ